MISCNYVYSMWEFYMHKKQEGANVKTHYKFSDDSMRMCFKHKTRMKVDCKNKDIIILFLSHTLWFFMEQLFHESFLLRHAHIYFSFIVVCITQQVMFISLYMTKVIKRNRGWKGENFSSMFFQFYFLLIKRNILICVFIIWLSFMHHVIII